MYKRVKLIDNTPVQFVGVYVVRWQKEWGQPEVGFIEIKYTLEDAIYDLYSIQLADNTANEAGIARTEIVEIFHRLIGGK